MRKTTSRDQDEPGASASLIWTLGLAAALVGLVALPGSRRPAGQPQGSDPGEARRPPPSHTGRKAEEVARAQADRGRRASGPTEIPAAGWKDILLRTWHDVGENRIMLVSAGVTFFALLAIFPAIAALVSLYGLVADPSTIAEQIGSLQGLLPQGALEIVGEQVTRLNEKGSTTLGLSLFVGLALSVWSANGGMKHVFDALNLVYDERESRGFVKLNLISLAFTGGALLFLVSALAAVIVLPIVFKFIGLGEGAWWLSQLRWPVLLVAVLFGLALLYRFGPSRDAPAGAGPPRLGAGGDPLARRIGALLVVCRQLRQVQPDLWVARRRHRVHDLDLAVDHHRAAGRATERRDGAPDRRGHDGGRARAPRQPPSHDGRYGRQGGA